MVYLYLGVESFEVLFIHILPLLNLLKIVHAGTPDWVDMQWDD